MSDKTLARDLENFRRMLRSAQTGAESLQLHGRAKPRAVEAGKLLRHLEDWCTTEINEARARERTADFLAQLNGSHA